MSLVILIYFFYLKVCNDGKAILDSIQSSQSTQVGQMEFKQAASHILDIVYEVQNFFLLNILIKKCD
jgi:hypothetical protein